MSFPGISKRQMESKYKNPKILDVDIVYPKENDEYSVACTELPTLGKFRNIIRICSIFAKEWAKLPNVYLFFSESKGKYFRNILRKFSSSHWMTIFSWTFLKWMGKLQNMLQKLRVLVLKYCRLEDFMNFAQRNWENYKIQFAHSWRPSFLEFSMKFRIFYDYLEFYTHRPSGPKRSQINRKLSLIYFEIISNNVKKI